MNIARYESLPAVRDIFDDFFRGFLVQPVPRALAGSSEAVSVSPRIDVVDENGTFKVRVDLPGAKKEDIKVSVDGDVLSIAAEIRRNNETKDGERIVYSERFVGRFARSIRLGVEIELEAAAAQFNDGVLELKLPKKSVAAKQLTVH